MTGSRGPRYEGAEFVKYTKTKAIARANAS
jgi:hypothetical protein